MPDTPAKRPDVLAMAAQALEEIGEVRNPGAFGRALLERDIEGIMDEADPAASSRIGACRASDRCAANPGDRIERGGRAAAHGFASHPLR